MLLRVLFLLPRKDDVEYFNPKEDGVLKILPLLYGLTDSGDYWKVTFNKNVREDLGMESASTDPSL